VSEPVRALVDERTVTAVTNAGQRAVRQGRLPLARIGREKFFGNRAVLIERSSDHATADGSVPLSWFAAVYVDPARRLIRLAR
jgi:hypothetical protein